VACDRVMLPVERGQLLPVRRWHAGDGARHAVIAIHGMMSHSGWFDSLGRVLLGRGISLFASDRRGSGEATALSGLEDVDAWVEDVRRLTMLARDHADQVMLFGWCGGARTALAALGAGLRADQVLLAAPALHLSAYFVDGFRRIQSMPGDILPLPFRALEDFSDDPEVRRFIAEDTLRWDKVPRGYFAPVGEVLQRALQALPEVRIPFMGLLASGDRLVDNDATRALFAGRDVRELDGGHAIVLERPLDVADLVEELARVGTSDRPEKGA
jgi:alpha-beta hydrolase superfamily lysophospholipase